MKTGIRSEPLYRGADLRTIEAVAADQPLMQRAGLAAADLATSLCRLQGASLLILAGPGNNGGDALVAARHLRERCALLPSLLRTWDLQARLALDLVTGAAAVHAASLLFPRARAAAAVKARRASRGAII